MISTTEVVLRMPQILGVDPDGDGLVSKTNVTPDYNLVAIRLNLTFPGAGTESLYFFLSQDD